MRWHVIVQAPHAHSMKERKLRNKKANRSKKKRGKSKKIKEGVLPHNKKGCGRLYATSNTERAKVRIPLHTNWVRLIIKWNNRRIEAQRKTTRKKTNSTLPTTAAVYGTSSIRRQLLPTTTVVGLVPGYPVCRIRPVSVNHSPPPKRVCQTIRNKQSRFVIHPRHRTPVLTLLEPQSRFEDKALKFEVVCPLNWCKETAPLKEVIGRKRKSTR